MTKHGNPPKAVSASHAPAAPKQSAGAFLSGKAGAPRSGSRRRHPLGAIPPPEDENARLTAVLNHRNPLLEASRVLLRALVDMPALIGIGHYERLRDLLMDEVRVFERLCDRANIRIEHRIGARYCLCTALDEAAMRALSAQNDASESIAWAADALAGRIGEDNQGGSKVYALAMRLLSDADEHTSLLEVLYRIFSLGFEGHYRQGAARGTHERLRERLYDAIVSRMPPVPDALSPHAQFDVTAQQRASYFEIPVWMSAAVASVALLGLYVYCRVDLATRADEVRQQIANIVRVATTSPDDTQSPRQAR